MFSTTLSELKEGSCLSGMRKPQGFGDLPACCWGSSLQSSFQKLESGPEKGVTTKGVFSLEESLESLESLEFLDSLESLENGRSLIYFSQSGGSLESLNSLETLEMDFPEKTPFLEKDRFFRTRLKAQESLAKVE